MNGIAFQIHSFSSIQSASIRLTINRLPLSFFLRRPQNANQNMSENQTATNGPNQLKRTTNYLINEQLAKIQQDTQELINRTIDIGQPAQVSVVKVSENKIIIEVDVSVLLIDYANLHRQIIHSNDRFSSLFSPTS